MMSGSLLDVIQSCRREQHLKERYLRYLGFFSNHPVLIDYFQRGKYFIYTRPHIDSQEIIGYRSDCPASYNDLELIQGGVKESGGQGVKIGIGLVVLCSTGREVSFSPIGVDFKIDVNGPKIQIPPGGTIYFIRSFEYVKRQYPNFLFSLSIQEG